MPVKRSSTSSRLFSVPWGDANTWHAALYAALLSLPLERYPPLQLSPQKQKQQTIEAIVDTLISLSTSDRC